MNTIVVIQVRMGSSRLPGKAMFPLGGEPALVHEIKRASQAGPFTLSDVVVATSDHPRDDVLELVARDAGADVYRGSEPDVLGRLYRATKSASADAIVRITGDNPLVHPPLLEALSKRVREEGVEYASNKDNNRFPIGLGASAISVDALGRVDEAVNGGRYREHVGKYFRDNPEEFSRSEVTPEQVFSDGFLTATPEFSDLRLTMDESKDYELLRRTFDGVPYRVSPGTETAITHIVENGLKTINEGVEQEVS